MRVTFAGGMPWNFSLGADIVQVYDTETRALAGGEARQRVVTAAALLTARPAPPPWVFKKVDSTLRGNLGIELEASLRGLRWPLAVLAPAFPANRRTVRGGRLFVDGIPVTETSLARDPRTPVRSDRLADAIHETSSLPTHEIGLDAVRAGPARLVEILRDLPGALGIAVVDAETEGDLDTVASTLTAVDRALPCGSAGLAHAVAGVWDAGPEGQDAGEGRADTEDHAQPAERIRCRAVVVAVGSAHPVAHEQLAVLRRLLDVPLVSLHPRRLADHKSRSAEVARARGEAARFGGRILALELAPDRGGGPRDGAARYAIDLAEVGKTWAESRGASGAGGLGLVCTGGDTALAFCRALEARAIWPEGEVSPGVPWSRIEAVRDEGLLVSKAGGFGGPTALVDAVRFLIEESAQAPRR